MDQNTQEPHTGTPAGRSHVAYLADCARAGDRSCFEQLVGMFQEEIFRMAFYRTGSRMDAEDLTQDTFMKAFKSLTRLKDTSRFRSWLFSIGVNRVRDFHKKKRILVFFGVKAEGKELQPDDRQPSENPNPLTDLIKQEFWGHMQCLANELSRMEREVFLLRFLDQLSIKEIAQALNRSESAVKTHLYRSLNKFRDNPGLARVLQGEN